MIIIEELSEKEIEEIIIGKEEGKLLEFKSDARFKNNDDKKEFLADLSSFANASGGDLLLGVIEKNGIAEKINGINLENPDKFKQQIENLARDSIKPNIPGFKFQTKKLSNGKYLIVISIRESFNKPHAVVVNKNFRISSRNSVGKYPLDIYDIKNLILESDSFFERILDFRQKRIFSILSQDVPLKFEDEESSKFIVHIIPHQSFFQKLNVDINEVRRWTELILPLTSDYCQQRLNFDGLFSYTSGSNMSVVSKYLQLYRNGIIESVNGDFTRQYHNIEKGVWGSLISSGTISLVKQIIELYKKLDVFPPIYVLVTLLGLDDHYMVLDQSKYTWTDLKKFDRDQLICPEVIIEDYECDLRERFQPIFDMIWNSVGFDRAYE